MLCSATKVVLSQYESAVCSDERFSLFNEFKDDFSSRAQFFVEALARKKKKKKQKRYRKKEHGKLYRVLYVESSTHLKGIFEARSHFTLHMSNDIF